MTMYKLIKESLLSNVDTSPLVAEFFCHQSYYETYEKTPILYEIKESTDGKIILGKIDPVGITYDDRTKIAITLTKSLYDDKKWNQWADQYLLNNCNKSESHEAKLQFIKYYTKLQLDAGKYSVYETSEYKAALSAMEAAECYSHNIINTRAEESVEWSLRAGATKEQLHNIIQKIISNK